MLIYIYIDTTEQTGATSSQRETDHHEPSDPSIVPSDTQTCK